MRQWWDNRAYRVDPRALAMPRLTDNELRFLLAAMVIAPFVLSLMALSFWEVPAGNKDLFIAGMGGLNTLVGAVAGWCWPRPAAPATDQEPRQ